MKKFLTVFTIVLMLTLSLFALTSCHEHSPVKVEGVPANCTETGKVEHYKCSCGKLFSDSEGKNEISDITLQKDPTKHKSVSLVQGSEATCSTLAVHDHYKCNGCNKLFLSQNAESEVSIEDLYYGEYGAHQSVVPVSAVSPKCTGEKGTLAHFKCNDCDKLSLTESFETVVSAQDIVDNVSSPVHVNVVFNQRVEPTCMSSGIREHYECKGCGKLYHDQNCQNEVISGADEIYLERVPTNHVLDLVPEVPSNCMNMGTKAYYHCTECFHDFKDENGTDELYDLSTWTLPIGGHDLDIVPGVQPTCSMRGYKDYYRCKDCYFCFLDEEGMQQTWEGSPDLELDYDFTKHSSLDFVQGFEATCMMEGQKDYYRCVSCWRMYEDEDCTREFINEYDTRIPLAPHEMTHHPEVAPTCQNNYMGNTEYYHCEVCFQDFSDENGEYNTWYEWTGYEYDRMCHPDAEFVEYKKQTCVQDGNSAYWHCTCGYYDEWFGMRYDDPSMFYQGFEKNEYSHNLIYLSYKEADCLDGHIECYHCEYCDNYYNLQVDTFCPDPSCIISKNEAVFPATGEHTVTKYNRVENTCLTAGNVEHWKCSVCFTSFEDQSCENVIEDVVIPAHGHGNYTTHQAVANSCKQEGNTYYVTCGYCNRDLNPYDSYRDITGHTSTGFAPHRTTHYDGVEPTCTTTGLKERYYCSSCGKNFADSACTDVILDIVLPMTDHTWGEYEYDENQHWRVATCCAGVISEKVDHNHDGHRTINPSTCQIQGDEEIYCTLCEQVTGSAKLGLSDHVYSNVMTQKVEPICNAVGYESHYTCLTCDNWFDSNKQLQARSHFEIAIDENAHNYEITQTDSTCQVQGEYKKVCSYCHDTQITYKPLASCSYEYASLNEYEHVYMCKWCDKQSGAILYHNFDDHYTCKDCKVDFDFTENLNCQTMIGDDGSYYVYIQGMKEGYSVPSVLKIPSVVGGIEVKRVDTFMGKTAITEIYLPARLDTIGMSAFKNCTNLTAVHFRGESELRSVTQHAFENCTKLATFNMPKTLEQIDEKAFYGTALTSVEFYKLRFSDVYLGNSFENCSSLEIAYFHEGCTFEKLPKGMFKNCTSLKTLRLPSCVKVIGEEAFYRCKALEGVSFWDNLEEIEMSAFQYAFDANLDISITIPESIKYIGYYAFAYSNISEVYLMGSVSYDNFMLNSTNFNKIGTYAFSNIASLDRVVIGENVKVLSGGMFSSCANLTEVEFRNSNNIRYFGTGAFRNTNLEEMTVTLGTDIEFFGYEVFKGEDGTTNVTVNCEDYTAFSIYRGENGYEEVTSEESVREKLNILIVGGTTNYGLMSMDHYLAIV